jgi:phosphate transport system protein
MTVHLRREIEKLRRMISSLATHVEEHVDKAVCSVIDKDQALAREVMEFDPEIDDKEVEVEEECLKILALHQPVANDLRYIVAVLKMNNDLERIGDLAVNIAEIGLNLATVDDLVIPYDLEGLVARVKAMLEKALDAMMEMDAELAREVGAADDEVDAINRRVYPEIQAAIRKHPDKIDSLIRLLRVSTNLERIADHATNIAEDVIYLVNGEIIRHTAGGSRENGPRKAS